ncbi:MAG: NUDIX hydrolase [Treponema sp.]|nr:NUDIX hydrolase [Treponema sp.]
MNDNDLIWKEESRTEVFKTPVFSVLNTKSISPDGQEGTYVILSPKDWACVIPEDGDNFLMVKQWRHGYKGLSIEFPGGVIDDGEKPEEAAVRELKEETGCTAQKMIYLGSCSPNPAIQENKMHYFLAQGLSKPGKQDLDDDEYVTAFPVPQKEVFAKMGSSEYPHALMIAALVYYNQYKATNS